MPVPKAVTTGISFSLEYTLSSLAFSTLSILPQRGRIAWNFLSRPPFAEPPAESPSTMYISVSSGSLDWQSASFPGSELFSSAVLRLASSLAFLAASLAREAVRALSKIALAVAGFSSIYSSMYLYTMELTSPDISVFPSFALVWPSNWASFSLTLITQVRPSRTSSPLRFLSFSLSILYFLA